MKAVVMQQQVRPDGRREDWLPEVTWEAEWFGLGYRRDGVDAVPCLVLRPYRDGNYGDLICYPAPTTVIRFLPDDKEKA